jgi:hypothetical protein
MSGARGGGNVRFVSKKPKGDAATPSSGGGKKGKGGATPASVYEQPKHDSKASTKPTVRAFNDAPTVTTMTRTAPVSAAFASAKPKATASADEDFWGAASSKSKPAVAPAAAAAAASSGGGEDEDRPKINANDHFPSKLAVPPLDMILYLPDTHTAKP